MKKRMGYLTLLMMNIAFVQQPIHAEEHNAGLGAHVHGLSTLTIAVDEQALEIELLSPSMNLVGFEHKAHTKEEITAIDQVASQLRQHETLFEISKGDCSHVNTTMDVSAILDEKDEHEHEHEEHSTHSEITVNYRYECKDTTELTLISIELFKSFPRIQEIHTMWVKPTGQGSVLLTPNSPVIEMR